MYSDSDIKIAGDKPSYDVKRNAESLSNTNGLPKNEIKKAKEWGKSVALEFVEDAKSAVAENAEDSEMLVQRRMLLSFTATVGFEQLCSDDALVGVAQKSFIDTLKANDNELYRSSSDTGAFSFYYLAFRRGGEIDRRIGQTFAMLCSHDGDPVYQELGEALYCWFISVVKSSAEDLNIE